MNHLIDEREVMSITQEAKTTEKQIRELLENHNDIDNESIEFGDGFVIFKEENTPWFYRVSATHVDCNENKEGLTNDYMKIGSYVGTYKVLAKQIAALLKKPEQENEPAKTLGDQVFGIVQGTGLSINHIHDDEVSCHNSLEQFWITSEHVIYGDYEVPIGEYLMSGERYSATFSSIAALLKPIKTDLPDPQQRIKELESDLKVARGWQSKYLDTKKHYDELKTKYQRLNGSYTQTIQRVKELEEQLQGCVSQADHEAVVRKWADDFGSVFDRSQKHMDQAELYKQWFEAEYAKNAEAGR